MTWKCLPSFPAKFNYFSYNKQIIPNIAYISILLNTFSINNYCQVVQMRKGINKIKLNHRPQIKVHLSQATENKLTMYCSSKYSYIVIYLFIFFFLDKFYRYELSDWIFFCLDRSINRTSLNIMASGVQKTTKAKTKNECYIALLHTASATKTTNALASI